MAAHLVDGIAIVALMVPLRVPVTSLYGACALCFQQHLKPVGDHVTSSKLIDYTSSIAIAVVPPSDFPSDRLGLTDVC